MEINKNFHFHPHGHGTLPLYEYHHHHPFFPSLFLYIKKNSPHDRMTRGATLLCMKERSKTTKNNEGRKKEKKRGGIVITIFLFRKRKRERSREREKKKKNCFFLVFQLKQVHAFFCWIRYCFICNQN